MHLIGNMTYLYIFGDNIEETLGKVKFIIFYFLTGGCAALTQALLDPSSTIPMVGASGAIAGILGGYLILFPRAKIKVFFWFIIFFKVIKIRAYIVLGGWILIQFISFNGNDLNSDGIAYAAHIGGFISGVILIYIIKNKKKIRHEVSKGSVPNSKWIYNDLSSISFSSKILPWPPNLIIAFKTASEASVSKLIFSDLNTTEVPKLPGLK